jgi:hypothetical protein
MRVGGVGAVNQFGLVLALLFAISGTSLAEDATDKSPETRTVTTQQENNLSGDVKDFENLRRDLLAETRAIAKDQLAYQSDQQWLNQNYNEL